MALSLQVVSCTADLVSPGGVFLQLAPGSQICDDTMQKQAPIFFPRHPLAVLGRTGLVSPRLGTHFTLTLSSLAMPLEWFWMRDS